MFVKVVESIEVEQEDFGKTERISVDKQEGYLCKIRERE